MARTRKKLQDTRGGLIARGRCERCKLDLGNVLDPYCWRCGTLVARQAEATIRAHTFARAAQAETRRAALEVQLQALLASPDVAAWIASLRPR